MYLVKYFQGNRVYNLFVDCLLSLTNLLPKIIWYIYVLWTFSTHCARSVRMRSFLWFIFSRIRTECGDLHSKSPYSVQMRENTDQKNLAFGHCSGSGYLEHDSDSFVKSSGSCVKSVQIRRFYWSVFYCVRTEYGDLRTEYRPEKTPYLGTFPAMSETQNLLKPLSILHYWTRFSLLEVKGKTNISKCKYSFEVNSNIALVNSLSTNPTK